MSYINKVAKIALGAKQTESSLNVYKDMKWLPLHLRRQVPLLLSSNVDVMLYDLVAAYLVMM